MYNMMNNVECWLALALALAHTHKERQQTDLTLENTETTFLLPRLLCCALCCSRGARRERERHNTHNPPYILKRKHGGDSSIRPRIHQGRKIHQTGACILYYTYLYCILYCICIFLAPATRDRCGGRKRDGASCLGCTLGTWLCSTSNSIIYRVSCYRFVSQHLRTHIYTT
jgi:hypothetical protein